MTSVTITTTGATFSPLIELTGGSTATVTWSCPGFSNQTGLNPTFSFGSAATRTVTMTVTGGGGNADVTALDMGYDNTVDVGTYMPPARFNKAPEAISGVSNINVLTGLIYFLADKTALAGAMDFTGMSALQFIQVFQTGVSAVTLTGCTALIRLQIEQANVSALDLNPVAACLYDLRAAAEQGGSIHFTTLTSNMAVEYHFCTRDNLGGLVNMPTPSQLPVIQQLWIWDCDRAGSLAPASSAINSVLSTGNHYTSADFTNQFPSGRGAGVDLSHNSLTSVVLNGCSGLNSLLLNSNKLSSATVDSILAVMDGFNTTGSTIDLTFNNPPTSAGLTHRTALISRGWTVNVDSGFTTDTPPYRLYDGHNNRPGIGSAGTQPPASSSDFEGGLTNSALFSVTQGGLAMTGFWFWRADSAQSPSAQFALWKVTGLGTATLVPGTHVTLSSMIAGVWNFAALAVPVPLAVNAPYAAVVGFSNTTHPLSGGQFGYVGTYNNGITNGPLNGYSDSTGGNPDPYGNPVGAYGLGTDPTVTYPTNSISGALFWVDVQVVPAAGLLMTSFP